MDADAENGMGSRRRERVVEQLGHMVESGRVTEQEADRVRAARGTDEFDEVVRGISLRHAETRLESAVADGSMTREETDGFSERLRNGEHPRSLRAHLGKLRPGRRSRSS